MTEKLERLTGYRDELISQAAELAMLSEITSWRGVIEGTINADDPILTSADIARETGWESVACQSMSNDRLHGAFWPFFRTELDLSAMKAIGRHLAMRDETGAGILQHLMNYTVGEGIQLEWQARDKGEKDDPRIKQAQAVTDAFLERNKVISKMQRALMEECIPAGEAVVIIKPCHETGIPRIRIRSADHLSEPTNPEVILDYHASGQFHDGGLEDGLDWSFGVAAPFHDIEDVRGYCFVWYGVLDAWEYLPPAQVVHVKLNVPQDVKRGVSDYYAAYANLERANKGFSAAAEGATLQASIAYIEKLKAGLPKAAVEDSLTTPATFLKNMPGRNGLIPVRVENITKGRILRTDRDVMYGPLGAPQGAKLVEVFQAILRRIGTRWGMPEWMVSGDASNNNMSSSITAGSAFDVATQARQQMWGDVWIEITIKAMAMMGVDTMELLKAARLTAKGHPIADRDEAQDEVIRETRYRNKVLSKRTWQIEVGLDPDEEDGNIATEPKPEPPPMPPGAGPPGAPPQGGEGGAPQAGPPGGNPVGADQARTEGLAFSAFEKRLREHQGPGPHDSGSDQSVHGGGGGTTTVTATGTASVTKETPPEGEKKAEERPQRTPGEDKKRRAEISGRRFMKQRDNVKFEAGQAPERADPEGMDIDDIRAAMGDDEYDIDVDGGPAYDEWYQNVDISDYVSDSDVEREAEVHSEGISDGLNSEIENLELDDDSPIAEGLSNISTDMTGTDGIEDLISQVQDVRNDLVGSDLDTDDPKYGEALDKLRELENNLDIWKDSAEERMNEERESLQQSDAVSERMSEDWSQSGERAAAEEEAIRQWARDNPERLPEGSVRGGEVPAGGPVPDTWYESGGDSELYFPTNKGDYNISLSDSKQYGVDGVSLMFTDPEGSVGIANPAGQPVSDPRQNFTVFTHVGGAMAAYVKEREPGFIVFSSAEPTRTDTYEKLSSVLANNSDGKYVAYSKRYDYGGASFIVVKTEHEQEFLRKAAERAAAGGTQAHGYTKIEAEEKDPPTPEDDPSVPWKKVELPYDPAWFDPESWGLEPEDDESPSEERKEATDCGANAEGGGGFQPGNSCADEEGGEDVEFLAGGHNPPGEKGSEYEFLAGENKRGERPDEVNTERGSITRQEADVLFQLVKEGGGFTYQPVDDTSPLVGYVVSKYENDTREFAPDKIKDTDIFDFMVEHAAKFDDPQHYVGAWTGDGMIHLDVNVVLKDRAAAEAMGIEHNQRAIWDIQGKSEIEVESERTKAMRKKAS